jgi:outer membrane protein assembly factor BamB
VIQSAAATYTLSVALTGQERELKHHFHIALSTARNRDVNASLKLPLKLQWRFKAGPMDSGISEPLATETSVLFLESHLVPGGPPNPAKLYALAPGTGKEQWRFDIPRQLGWLSRNCLVGDMVITSDDRDVIGIRNATKCWQAEGVGIGTYAIVYDQHKLILSRRDGVYSVDPEMGSVMSRFEIDRPSAVAIYGDKIVFGQLPGSSLYCLDGASSFQPPVWRVDLSKTGEYYSKDKSRIQGRDVYVPGGLRSRFPVISEGSIYGCLGQDMASFDLATGAFKWKGLGKGDPIIREDRLYSWSTCQFICLNAGTGQTIYAREHKNAIGFIPSMPLLVGRYFFIGTKNLYAFDIETGEMAWEFKSKRTGAHFGDPGYINGRLYAGCRDGYIYCFAS